MFHKLQTLVDGVDGVPNYLIEEYSPRKTKYLVAVFVINEGERIQKQLTKMHAVSGLPDFVIADGGSTDGSLEPSFLRQIGAHALLQKVGPGKLSAQMRMAFHYAIHAGYEGVVVIDGNDKDVVDSIPNFVSLLRQGFDHIQGSRFIEGGKAVNTPFSRLIALRCFHSPLISLASGKRQTDTTNGFRAYSKKLLTDSDVSVFRDVFQTYELHYHLAIEAGRGNDFRIIETPVTRVYPKYGKVPTKISPFRGNLHIMKILLLAVTGKYRRLRSS